MGKREDAHRELAHALRAMGDAKDSQNFSRLVRPDAVLHERDAFAWIAYTNAIMAVDKLTRHRRPKDNERYALTCKLAPIMLDILLGEEE